MQFIDIQGKCNQKKVTIGFIYFATKYLSVTQLQQYLDRKVNNGDVFFWSASMENGGVAGGERFCYLPGDINRSLFM